MKINEQLVWDYPLTPDILSTEGFKELYIRRILVRGTRQDILDAGLETIREYLPRIPLSADIRDFWQWFFAEGERYGNPHKRPA